MKARSWWFAALASLSLAACDAEWNAGPIRFAASEKQRELLAEQPRLRSAVGKAVVELYGDSPRDVRAPSGAPLLLGGAYLGNKLVELTDGTPGPVRRSVYEDPATGELHPVAGGYALYRQHCLHCHGINGDGRGPTAAFLWPRPRDFRQGVFKFTSSLQPDKPTRADLRRTITHGLANSAMPAFEALMSDQEIEQVIDYTIYLSLRGETELRLIDLATIGDEAEADTYLNELKQETLTSVFDRWKSAETDVLNPPIRRVPSSDESILRGRTLFLGQTTEKLECAGCHGPKADGTGLSWIDLKTYNQYVFYGEGTDAERFAELKAVAEKAQKKWSDNWGNPLRPANLNRGDYKGGRRPLDIYWRIAKGINGTPMPSHLQTLKPEQIWDLVNFVLALPYQPDLLNGLPPLAPAPPAPAPTVAARP